MILRRRGTGPFKKLLAERAAEGNKEFQKCPNCPGDAKLIAKYNDRSTYKCNKCGAECTYTKLPERMLESKKDSDLHAFKFRDKSKEGKVEKPKEIVKTNEKVPEEKVPPAIKTVQEGMEKRKIITFNYTSKDGKQTVRNVEPYKLSKGKDGEVILYAFCLEGEGIRAFKFKGMSNVTVQSFDYEPRWPIEDKLSEDTGRVQKP